MLHTDGFLHHVGSMAEIGGDYLPPIFVDLIVSLRYPILILILALTAIAFALPRIARRASLAPGGVLLLATLLQSAAMFLAAVPFHQVPDEVFVSLIQSRNLAEAGRYSFYPDRNVDGTGDGLFYIAAGALHAVGIPAPFAATLLCAAFGAASIGLLYRHTFDVTLSHGWAWLATFLAGIAHCFGRLAGTSWSASLLGLLGIAGVMLWRSSRWPWTFLVTGLLPFVRYDFSYYTVATGALFVLLCAVRGDRPWRLAARYYVLSLLGVAGLLVTWKLYYGHFVPTCILMKAGWYPDSELMWVRLVEYAGELWPFLAIILLGCWFTPWRNFADLMPWILAGGVHLVLVLLGGGDYFMGNRYQILLTVAVICAAVTCMPGLGAALRGTRALSPVRRKALLSVACATLVVVGFDAVLRPSGLREVFEGTRIPVREPNRWVTFSMWGPEAMTASRINHHAFTGRFFSRLTEGRPDTRMASLEVASAFYFFDGVPLDVQGFVDRNVATGPRNPKPRWAWDKRRDPLFWERERPDIVWLDTSNVIRPDMRFHEYQSRLDSFLRWSRHWNWTRPYLDHDYLRHNYLPRATYVNDHVLILWLARADVADEYDRRLAELGFRAEATFP